MEISWTDRAKADDLHRVKEEQNPSYNKKVEGYLHWSHRA
jgi:hypothetical protein